MRLTHNSFMNCEKTTRQKAFWAPTARSLNKSESVMSLAMQVIRAASPPGARARQQFDWVGPSRAVLAERQRVLESGRNRPRRFERPQRLRRKREQQGGSVPRANIREGVVYRVVRRFTVGQSWRRRIAKSSSQVRRARISSGLVRKPTSRRSW